MEKRADALLVLFAVAALDALFATALRLGGPVEAAAAYAGIAAVTVMGAIAATLTVRSDARGAWALALAIPATVSASWCVGMCFALEGPMHFIRWAGLWTRGTDTAWLGRLTLIGLACGAAFGVVLALVMRARARDRTLVWTFGATAIVAAISIPVLGLAGVTLASIAQIALAVVARRDVRAMRSAESEWHRRMQLHDALSGWPYRAPEAAPLDLLREMAQSMRDRALGASTVMLATTLIAALATLH